MQITSTNVIALREEVAELKGIVQANVKATEELVDAWRTAKGLVRLVKLLGALSASFAAVWALFKMGVLGK